MRVLYIISNLEIGGAEMMLLKLLQRLDRRSFHSMVISLKSIGPVGKRIEELGISVVAIEMNSFASFFSDFIKLLRIIKKFRPDVVHTWLYHADILGGIAAKIAGINKIFWSIRSCNLDSDKTSLSIRLTRLLGALGSHFIPQCIFLNSHSAKSIHGSLGYNMNKMCVIPNGFDVDLFHPNPGRRKHIRARLAIRDDELLIGMIGRFDPLKNHDGFIASMEKVCSKVPDVKILLVGKNIDSSNKKLMQVIETTGLYNKVIALGERNDIPELVAAMDILVCPSHAEAFPNILGEAMAAATPCVATDVGDCSYIIGNTGYIVPVRNVDALALCIINILTLSLAKRIELGKLARERIVSYFEIQSIVSKYEKAYIHAMENNNE